MQFLTNMDEIVMLGAEHPLELRYSQTYAMDLPYVHVRDGLYARLGRNVYHALAGQYGTSIESDGVSFALGRVGED